MGPDSAYVALTSPLPTRVKYPDNIIGRRRPRQYHSLIKQTNDAAHKRTDNYHPHSNEKTIDRQTSKGRAGEERLDDDEMEMYNL